MGHLDDGPALRIGLVGSGRMARERHLPGFRALGGVEVLGICSRRRENASRLAREAGIPHIYDTWEYLVDDDAIDAVVVATWPDAHAPVALAALDAGKHVLIQSRLAMNAREAQRLLDKSREHPGRVARVVPGPYGLAGDRLMRTLIDGGFTGTLREVHAASLVADLADPSTPLTWRQVTRHVGFNMLDLGDLHEAVARWTPPAVRVFAVASRRLESRRLAGSGRRAKVGTPDSVQAVVAHDGGASGTYRVAATVWQGEGRRVVLHGSEGTLAYDLDRDLILAARAGEPELKPWPIPDDLCGGWTAESDFVSAVRGGPAGALVDLAAAARHMQFVEAVARSSRHQEPVELPLREFSNPSL